MTQSHQPPLTNFSSLGPAIEQLYTALRGATPAAASITAQQFIGQQVGGSGFPGLYYQDWDTLFARHGTVVPALQSGALVQSDAEVRDALAEVARRLVWLAKNPGQARLNAAVRACEVYLEVLGVDPVPPDGPEGGCWVWWRGKRYPIPKGGVYRMADYFWHRASASFDELEGPVFDGPFFPQTVRSLANKLHNVLHPIGVPWRLSINSTTRHVTKQPRP
jgi:hypothetical protein